MKIEYYNVNYKIDLNIPEVIKEINSHITSTCNNLPALKIASDAEVLKSTIDKVKNFSKDKKAFIILGTGGSSLGAKALINIKNNNNNIHFIDNIDPNYFENFINKFDLNSTGLIVISKSGYTPETLSQFGAIVELASNNNSLNVLFSNTLVITEFKDSPLFSIAKNNKCKLLEHNKKIGGRYSVFSNVGMVPAIIGGLDVKDIQKGANKVINAIDNCNFFKLGQIFSFQNNSKFTSSVIMTYSDYLFFFGKWYLQLWAESIGKNGKGITPIHSIGTTDQHSQLQLFLDGPRDKFFTFITTNHSNKGLKINYEIMESQGVDYLKGRNMGDLMQAEQQATIQTFKDKNFQFREILLPQINEEFIGSLMAASIVETIACCIYFEIDPFNQPAVEQGKILTKKYLR